LGVEIAPLLWRTALGIFALTVFLDLLDLSFGRILWFVRTLRFWLYFTLHFGLSCLAAYLLRTALTDWYLLAPVATFLGVAVISNTDVKIAGYSLVPIAQLFISVKAKMFEQAAEDKKAEATKARLIERLQRLEVRKIVAGHSAALLGAGYSAERVQRKVNKARQRAQGSDDYLKTILVAQLVGANRGYAEQNIDQWER